MNHIAGISLYALLVLFTACDNDTASSSGNVSDTDKHMASEENSTPVVKEGERLFEAKCIVCHGADGTARIANAANLKKSRLDTLSVMQIVQKGKGGMPSFKETFTEVEMQKLINYVYTLRK